VPNRRSPSRIGARQASNHGAERANHFLDLRTPRILPPVIEVGRMKRAYVDRQVCAPEANWDEEPRSAPSRASPRTRGLH